MNRCLIFFQNTIGVIRWVSGDLPFYLTYLFLAPRRSVQILIKTTKSALNMSHIVNFAEECLCLDKSFIKNRGQRICPGLRPSPVLIFLVVSLHQTAISGLYGISSILPRRRMPRLLSCGVRPLTLGGVNKLLYFLRNSKYSELLFVIVNIKTDNGRHPEWAA